MWRKNGSGSGAANPQGASSDPGDSRCRETKTPGKLSFSLVVVMLALLFLLTTVLLVAPAWLALKPNDPLIDYYKWALAVLLGAFGAWIGAGAAYFFGKENLAESSRSTETALKIQQGALDRSARKERVKDLVLTAMNSNFTFTSASKKEDVLKKLAEPRHAGYWWVPVLDKEGRGVLEDVVHARVFWGPGFNDTDFVGTITAAIESDPKYQNLKPFHGPSFFKRVSLDEALADLATAMDRVGAQVGIVVDEKGKPTYCFTRQDLSNAQR